MERTKRLEVTRYEETESFSTKESSCTKAPETIRDVKGISTVSSGGFLWPSVRM